MTLYGNNNKIVGQYLTAVLKMRFSAVLHVRKKIAELTLKHSNLPESYIRQCTELIEYSAPKLPSHRQVVVKKYKDYYDLYKPWTKEFQMTNYPVTQNPKIWVEPIKDWCFFRGDRVEILQGKDKGKQGIITYIVQERNWVVVQGLNTELVETGLKKMPFKKRETPLIVGRQVALVDPVDLKPTKVEWRYDEDGERVRVSLRSGKILPIPAMEEETYDYKVKSAYEESSKDTVNAEITKVTFVPGLKTFEMDIMEELKITEDRIPAKTYWY